MNKEEISCRSKKVNYSHPLPGVRLNDNVIKTVTVSFPICKEEIRYSEKALTRDDECYHSHAYDDLVKKANLLLDENKRLEAMVRNLSLGIQDGIIDEIKIEVSKEIHEIHSNLIVNGITDDFREYLRGCDHSWKRMMKILEDHS